MTYRRVVTDIRTGETSEELFDDPTVITHEQTLLNNVADVIAEENAAIQRQLDANDIKAMRAVLEGDTIRIEEHKKRQAALRAKLR